MKQIIIFLILVVVQLSECRVRRQAFFGSLDLKKVPLILNNKAAVDAHVKCLLATDAEAVTICDRIGKRLREVVPEAVKNAKCPEPCSEDDKKTMTLIIRILQQKYPEHFANLLEHYKVTPEQKKQLDDWVASIPAQ